jgi:hypothetical protein
LDPVLLAGWKVVTVTNTLAYYGAQLIAVAKGFHDPSNRQRQKLVLNAANFITTTMPFKA